MRIRPITRGPLGGDAVYCAAYRGGRSLWNERTGDLYKWAGREDVRDTSIVLPGALTHDPAFDWAKDPYKLWNTAEFTETQHNSRVARDYMMLLPGQMTQEQRRDVVYRFAQVLADRYGNAIDVALHDSRTGRARNYHAHLLGTTRKLGPQGLLGKTDAEVSGKQRAPRGLRHTYRQEYAQVRGLWEHMLQEAIKGAQLPRQVYETLYREYGKGETTWQYHKRLMHEGFDLKKQQREDRRKTQHTPEERQESAQRKLDIRKFNQLERKARVKRKLDVERLRLAGQPLEGPERHKRTWLPRWDANHGLLKPWEVESQTRRVGETQAMVPWLAKANPGPEPQLEPEPKTDRLAFSENQEAQPEDIRIPVRDPVREWLAHKLGQKPDDEREVQAVRDWLTYKPIQRYEPIREQSRERARSGPEYNQGR